MTIARKRLLLAAKLMLTIAVGLIATACAEADKYGKEEKETIVQVAQAPYNFSIEPACPDETHCTLRLTIKKDDAIVSGATGSATVVANDGSELKTQFQESNEQHIYEASLPLKQHTNYVAKTELQIEGKTFSPIFSFHCSDPSLNKHHDH